MHLRSILLRWASFAACVLSIMSGIQAAEPAVYLDATKPLETRVDDLLARLTLEEKIALCHGDSKFTTAAIPRLGLPRRWLSDGPLGVREDVGPDSWKAAGRTDDFATYLPASLALAATWNPELARQAGRTVGEEARKRGKDIMLAPGVNIMRTPLCGRNFEYYGEDPWLTGRMAVGYIQGMQSTGVAACVKHFAANNQETHRASVNVEVDERTLHEIYLPAFKAAVQEGHVWTVMAAYNRFRGEHCAENDYLLNQVLKQGWGFQGLVMSDWAGVHTTRGAVLSGLDLEMGTLKPYDEFFLAGPFREGVKSGEYPLSMLDDKARRNLRVMIATGVLDQRHVGSLNTKAHQDTARQVAEEGMVLLKNEGGLLPLAADRIKSIAVIGENATRLQAYAKDSARIKTFYEITPLAGILNRVGRSANVTYSEGYRKGGGPELVGQAVAAARAADVVIFVGGLNREFGFDCEDGDKAGLELPFGQAELIGKLAKANPRLAVVLVGGSPMEMDAWLAQVPAVLLAWYPGMEGGSALARVLFGDVNPSGKLPATFPRRLADSPAHAAGAAGFPGVNDTVAYAEGLFVGYRWFDAKNIEPLFPFGFGLSYTTFEYSNLKLIRGDGAKGPVVTAEFSIRNTGLRAGAEIAQVYVRDVKSSVARPPRELKGFRKVMLPPGGQVTVSVPLGREAFAFYDVGHGAWLAEAGEFEVLAAASSRDIRLTGKFPLERNAAWPDKEPQ